jgi:flagellar biosynthesis/type III secretory pathway protein FliH
VVKRELQYELTREMALAMKKANAGARVCAQTADGTRETAEIAGAIQTKLEEAEQTAADILRDAEQTAADTLRAAERAAADQTEAWRRQAEESGYRAGYAAGVTDGAEAAEAAVGDHIRELTGLGAQMRQARLETLQREEQDLIQIALEAARRIMRQQCRVDGSAVSKMLEEILQENEDVLRLYLSEFQNTLEFHLDKSIAKKIRQFARNTKTILVKENDSIMLETETGMIDVSVPTQLELLKRMLETAAPAAGGDGS